jgi:putative ABC transport system permease protein
MFRNFLVVSLRSFLRNKTYTLINIAGLTLGLASATLIFLFIYDEITYDSIHPEANRIYTAGISVIDKNGNKSSFGETPGGWSAVLKEKFPAIEAITRFQMFGFPTSIQNKDADLIVLNQDGDLYWVEKDLGNVLYLPMVKGNPEKALELPNSMVISESAAKTLFGTADPINKLLTIKHPYATFGREVEYVVTGVFHEFPSNTFFRPKYLLNINGLRTALAAAGRDFNRLMNGNSMESWFMYFYFRMKENSSMDGINAELVRLSDFATKSDSGFYASGRKLAPIVKPLPDLHFDENVNWHFVDDSGSQKAVLIFGGIACLILIIAAINYMNLATARSVRRAKEVGIRKTLGSKRSELAFQFIQESALTTFLAMILSIIVIILLLPSFNQLTNKYFTLSSLTQPIVLVLIVCLTLFVTFLGGSYPAFYLSGFRPAEVLKGIFSGGRGDGLRKALVTFQFAVAILLAIATYAIISQMNLIQQSKLNESGDQILSIRYGTVAPNEKYPAFKNALNQDKDLEYVTIGNHLPRHDYFGGTEYTFRLREVDDKEYTWSQLNVDFDFPKTYSLEFIAGRDFDAKNPSDSNSIILNERAAKDLHKGINDVLGLQAENTNNHLMGKVIGVVKDFPYQSAYHTIGPLVISPRPDEQDRIVYIKLPEGKAAEKIKFIEETWKATIPGIGFDYWFVSDEFNRLYKKEQKISAIAKVFAALAMGITILGLYGLASYMAEQKTKEIGIRKAMGASVGQIAFLFMSIFLKIFLVGSLIALPISYYFVDNWLKTFAYRIGLGPSIFVISVAGVLALMLLTIFYETVKAARANPVKALKHE